MNKQTKMLLGVALLGVAGYMLWKQSKSKASFSGGVQGPRTRFTSFSGGVEGPREQNYLGPVPVHSTHFSGGVQGPHEYNGTNFVGPQGLPKDKTKFTKFVGEGGTGVQGGVLVNGKRKFFPSNFGK